MALTMAGPAGGVMHLPGSANGNGNGNGHARLNGNGKSFISLPVLRR
jgi:hypothetical protein